MFSSDIVSNYAFHLLENRLTFTIAGVKVKVVTNYKADSTYLVVNKRPIFISKVGRNSCSYYVQKSRIAFALRKLFTVEQLISAEC